MPCHFTSPIPGYRIPKASKIECGGECTTLDTLQSIPTVLYGCTNTVDLVLLRGRGEEIDWNNESLVARLKSLEICTAHLKYLITEWDNNTVNNIKKYGKLSICSLPAAFCNTDSCGTINQKSAVNSFTIDVQVDHAMRKKTKNVKTRTRMKREDAILFMKTFGIICHPGTLVCYHHLNLLRAKEFDKFDFQKDVDFENESNGAENELTYYGQVENIDEELSDDDNDSTYEPHPNDLADAYELNQPHTSRSNSPYLEADPCLEDDRIRHLRTVLTKFNIERITSGKSWPELAVDTQRKKVNSIISFLDLLFEICAGDHWKEMKNDFLKKMKLVEPDPRIESIMNNIGSCLEDTSDKMARLSVLKVVTGLFSEKEIVRSTGASRYLVRQSKVTDFDEIVRLVATFKRERYDRDKVIAFLRFLARPEILIALPHACKMLTLDSGNHLPIASMARIYSYREIFRLYGLHCEEVGKSQGLIVASDIAEFVRSHSLGFSTAFKLMEVLAPSRKIQMTCVDSYQASAFDAFDAMAAIVDELFMNGIISKQTATDLRRRIRIVKSFIFGEMRLHIAKSSNVLMHCWTHALSHFSDARFSDTCSHIHDSSCRECTEAMQLPEILSNIVAPPLHDAEAAEDVTRHRLGRMQEIIEESDQLIRSFRYHLIRCVSSEHDRRQIIDNLQEGHALIVADYAMKILPTDSIEKQSSWFAKTGVPFHMSAVTARINGELCTHSFGHLSGISKQDSTSVAGILHHDFEQLKENGVTHVHLRTDNAGTYHCIGLIATLYHMTDKIGICILSHIFSEPQFGKGAADQKISLCKGKLSSFIDSGHSATTPSEMFDGFTSNILLKGCSFYIIEVQQVEPSRSGLNGVKMYSSFRFENGEGVRVKRHDAIGQGMMVEKERLSPIEYSLKIHKQGGWTSGTDNFWKPIKKIESASAEEEEINTEDNKTSRSNRKLCPDEMCRSRFLTDSGLEAHVTSGRHSYYKFTETVSDFAAQQFSELLETTESAQLAIRNDSIIPIVNNRRMEEETRGWALRKADRIHSLNQKVKAEVERMIQEDIDANRRAEAREIRNKLRELKNPDESYRFTLKNCLNEGQIKTQITRVLNKNKKSDKQEKAAEEGEDELTIQVSSQSASLKKQPKSSFKENKTVNTGVTVKKGRGRKRKCEEVEKEVDINEAIITQEDIEEDCFLMMHQAITDAHDQIFL